MTIAAPKIRPVNATIEPTERSNSPPIMRSAAPIAKMPSWAAGVMKFRIPARVNILGSAVKRKKIVTRARPAMAPSSGRFMSREMSETFFTLSSALSTARSDILFPSVLHEMRGMRAPLPQQSSLTDALSGQLYNLTGFISGDQVWTGWNVATRDKSVLCIESEEDNRQVALKELLLVDCKCCFTVSD